MLWLHFSQMVGSTVVVDVNVIFIVIFIPSALFKLIVCVCVVLFGRVALLLARRLECSLLKERVS